LQVRLSKLGALIWLQLLYPNRIKEISQSKFGNFSLEHRIWSLPIEGRSSVQRSEFLSHQACEIVHTLQKTYASFDSQDQLRDRRLFPEIAEMSELQIAAYTVDQIQTFWYFYRVNPLMHKALFRVIAKEFSMFSTEFIDKAVTRNGFGPTEFVYEIQRRALADWWGMFLVSATKRYHAQESSFAQRLTEQRVGVNPSIRKTDSGMTYPFESRTYSRELQTKASINTPPS
jgi:hypothetical protein